MSWGNLDSEMWLTSHHHHPQDNAMKQVYHILCLIWTALLEDTKKTWVDILSAIQPPYIPIHVTHKYSSHQVSYGQSLKLPVDCHLPDTMPSLLIDHHDCLVCL